MLSNPSFITIVVGSYYVRVIWCLLMVVAKVAVTTAAIDDSDSVSQGTGACSDRPCLVCVPPTSRVLLSAGCLGPKSVAVLAA